MLAIMGEQRVVDSGVVDLGVVSLAASPLWNFFPLQDRVVGRPATGVGALQIIRLPDGVVPPRPSHEQCMAAALAAAGYDRDAPGSSRAKEYCDGCIAGGESFEMGSDYVRVWYRHCQDGMIAAWYACPSNRAKERTVIQTMNDADRMIATLRLRPPVA
jgi:hypothetical protein